MNSIGASHNFTPKSSRWILPLFQKKSSQTGDVFFLSYPHITYTYQIYMFSTLSWRFFSCFLLSDIVCWKYFQPWRSWSRSRRSCKRSWRHVTWWKLKAGKLSHGKCTLQGCLTYPPKMAFWVDDFPFPKVGYVNFVEGNSWTFWIGSLGTYMY